jgi:radical SAM superfamily enzyme YgiQ (UPF0313 family)
MRNEDFIYNFPLGEAYLASALESSGNYVDILDLDVQPELRRSVYKIIKNGNYGLVGVGFSSARYPHVVGLLADIRKACDVSGASMVVGGYGASSIPEFILRETESDFVICGEGEEAIKYLVKKLESKEPVERIIKKPQIINLDSIPFPAWHLFDMNTYTNSNSRFYKNKGLLGAVLCSRGCIGSCSFCYRMHKGYRFRNDDCIIEEIKLLHSIYGIDCIFFYDEMAFSSTKKIKSLLNEFDKLPFDIRWNTSVRVEVMQKLDNVKMMKDYGCVNVGIGFESMNSGVLKRINKKVTPEHNRIAMENCNKVGLDVSINMLWNMPGDTVDTLWENVQFILDYSSWNECRTIRPVTPYPGCPLYYQAIKEGKLSGPKDFYNKFLNLDRITVNFTDLPEEIMYEELYKANSVLIDAYVRHTGDNYAGKMLNGFYDLYFNLNTNFRGVR